MSETAAVAQSTTPPSKKRKISLAGTESSAASHSSALSATESNLNETNGCNISNTAILQSSGSVKES